MLKGIRRAVSSPTRRLVLLPRKDNLIIPVDTIVGISTEPDGDGEKIIVVTATDDWVIPSTNQIESKELQSKLARLRGDLIIIPDDDDGITMLDGFSIVTRANALQATIGNRMIQLPDGNIIKADTMVGISFIEKKSSSTLKVYLDDSDDRDITLDFTDRQRGLVVRKHLVSLLGDQVLLPDGTRWDR